MCVRKDAGIEQARLLCSEEPLIVSQERFERYEGFFGLGV